MGNEESGAPGAPGAVGVADPAAAAKDMDLLSCKPGQQTVDVPQCDSGSDFKFDSDLSDDGLGHSTSE